MKSNKVSQMGLLIALAFVLSYLESLLPIQFGIPGVKLGLANIVVIIAIVQFDEKEAFFLTLAKAILVGVTFGSLYSMAYSMAGGILSTIVMVIMHRTGKFSVVGISEAGGAVHNIGQVLVAMIVLKSMDLKYYLGFLVICGLITGFIIGITAKSILCHIRKI